ncbi:nucleotidyltransferase domain-containing protein [Halalkalibacter akibai]|uniref:Renal dipeptidase n=1 Tax=Halalkalibacter akibai (strain ATCC 43226 / DSM 21942 / CIP 109018 / JCM 9157 / 1139) TaxID=1236973 RepID=W4QXB1_HALA3|nr:nucleotidyltransferase family protein [Halalkalibacter akibai]GAE35944.1 hypothetical protein JCM9157_3086 [Halalkalibacter akibai JCM 9157]
MRSEPDVAKLPKELTLILQFINDNKRLIQKEQLQDVDWNYFLELAIHHRLFPLLHKQIRNYKNNIIPGYVCQTLEKQYKFNVFRMLQLSGEMEQLSKLLLSQNINSIFIKGPVIAHDLYGDISLRTSSDLDFLVELKNLEKVEIILKQLGYVKKEFISSVLNDWKWRHSNVIYFDPVKDVKVEIHWRLHPGPGKEPSFNELWQRSRVSNLTQSIVHFLGKEDLFLFLISHGARHGYCRLRWLYDIHRFMQQDDINWEKLDQLIKTHQNRVVIGLAGILTSKIFATKLPENMDKFVASTKAQRLATNTLFYLEDMINVHEEPPVEEVSRYHSKYLFSLMSMPQKMLFILSFLYPYAEDAATLPLPKSLHFLYFPLRPMLWAWRKTKKQALS